MNFFHTHISNESINLINKTLKSGFINQGPIVDKLENKLLDLGYNYPVTVNSCTSALHLALEIIDVKGKEVILPAQTFIATGLAVLMAGGIPRFCDIEYNYNISYNHIKNLINKNTACIVLVNWAGNPCDNRIFNLLPTIHDLAHSFGYISPATISCYSFQAIKQVTAGDGGLICLSNENDYILARKKRWFGINKDTMIRNELGERVCNIDTLGYKYNMNDLDASLIIGNINTFPERLARRKDIHNKYYNIKNKDIVIIKHEEGSSHWLCNCLVKRRNDFIKHMSTYNIPVSVVDRRIDTHDIFKQNNILPIQELVDKYGIHIPLHEALTDNEVDYIISTIEKGW